MRSRRTILALGALGASLAAGAASARDAQDGALAVGIKQAPPFAMRLPDGSWTGLSVELWDHVAADLGATYRLEERELEALLDGIADGSLDAALGALTVTAERERAIDFTHPFHTSGLGVAVKKRSGLRIAALLDRVLSLEFASALLGLGVVLLVAGVAVWLLERRRNPQQFGGGVAQGVGSGFWWAAVTMTTVGYGDKAPVSASGRALALFWMFFSVITISGFTAAIASTLTVSQLGAIVQSPADLARVRVASIEDTTGEAYLRERRLAQRPYASAGEALRALEADAVDAVVYDAPILRHLVSTVFGESLAVVPFTLERQDYAIALPSGSPLREPVNRSLLERIGEESWRLTVERYLGE